MEEKKLTLLIVDDEDCLLKQLNLVFEKEYEIKTAASAEIAIEILNESIVDICLSDLKMPGKDGMELAKILADTHPHLPFILMTGHGDRDSLKKFLRLGIFDWIDKPFEIQNMLATVARAAEAVLKRKEFLAEERRNVGKALVVSYNHNIRNPLMIVTGYLEKVRKDIDQTAYEKLKNAVTRIEKLLADLEETVTISIEFESYIRAEKMIRLQTQATDEEIG